MKQNGGQNALRNSEGSQVTLLKGNKVRPRIHVPGLKRQSPGYQLARHAQAPLRQGLQDVTSVHARRLRWPQ